METRAEKVDRLLAEGPGMMDLHLALQQLKDQKIVFDHAVALLVNAHKITFGEAADRLRGAEAITGIYLEGDDLQATHDPVVGERLANPGLRIELNDGPELPRKGQYVNFTTVPLQESEGNSAESEGNSETLFCTICGNAIPEARARRQTATCSEKCKNRLDTIRAHQRAERKCPACLHPSSPAEREAFRIWRAERGEISGTQVKRDRTLPNKWDMAQALKRAANELQELADTLAAQLATDALETKTEALAIGSRERKQAEARLERVTNLIRDCKHWATPKGH